MTVSAQPKKSVRQLRLFSEKKETEPYGGSLMNTRRGRSGPRPLGTKSTMHLVLRSTKAKGVMSFRTPKNQIRIKEIVKKFARKYGVKIHSMANVGNHLHFQIKLSNHFGYFSFIRAITGAIALTVTGVSRWDKLGHAAGHTAGIRAVTKEHTPENKKKRFWDHRPFTRIVKGLVGFFNLRDYITLNEIEGFKNSRVQARMILERIKEREFQNGRSGRKGRNFYPYSAIST